ncbi:MULTISPECIES: ATP-binding protein [unclassified Chelatococcus]|uniref:ATP-binding protein n=1 Tax=unclassified Chelatococcus TaxID=2638111 RepID=UPI001BCFE53E|nr:MULTISPECIES: ATP-binding protein [unclassified Chelatococcus]CAH1654386.1 Histidine kinase [Hyphomicrobiales bacterium]MBS7742790.1 HAMP domain-containing protein [Chelatococcus sp. HY11]MBX3542092.1 HAMP domain-containing protein [Chelatococcus sp.]MCO5075692.1 ATP-binding protein [Chelatococcus sp.]CAH1694888.1 Histidine kinase [Hyphomicrobiales bacterium]
MESLSSRIVLATTLVFMTALVGTFLDLAHESKYGFFRIQQNSLTVQVESLVDRVRFIDGKPTLELGNLAAEAGKTVSYALLDSEGGVLQSFGLAGVAISPAILERYDIDYPFWFSFARLIDANSGDAVTLILPDADGAQRIVVTIPARDHLLVQVSMPLLDNTISNVDVLYTLTEASVVAVILPLILTMLAIPLIVRLTLQPIRRVSRQAAKMEAATLDRRLSLHRVPSEIRGLVLAFNDLLARLDKAWRLQREFTANAAHELRTPIAALRAEVEAIVPAPTRSILAIHFDKVARLLAQLLALAEADSRPIDAAARLDLMALARAVVADMAPTVFASGREIAIELCSDKLTAVRGDLGLAEIALRNLIDNAVRHSRPGSAIRVVVDGTRISVANTGSDISEETQKAMFKRFWKQDRRSGGSGLGLSIVSAIMTRLGGSVDVSSFNGAATFALNFQTGACGESAFGGS